MPQIRPFSAIIDDFYDFTGFAHFPHLLLFCSILEDFMIFMGHHISHQFFIKSHEIEANWMQNRFDRDREASNRAKSQYKKHFFRTFFCNPDQKLRNDENLHFLSGFSLG